MVEAVNDQEIEAILAVLALDAENDRTWYGPAGYFTWESPLGLCSGVTVREAREMMAYGE